MFWPLTVILLAVAAFGVLVTHRRCPAEESGAGGSGGEGSGAEGSGTDGSGTDGPGSEPAAVVGFVHVGSAALVVLAAGVVVLGLRNDSNGRAESVAVLGFLAYGLYLVAALVISHTSTPRR